MKWLVTWLVVTWMAGICSPIITHDPYLGEIVSPYIQDVVCYETEVKPMERLFDSKEEALKFIEDARPLCGEDDDNNFITQDSCVKGFELTQVN